jgi:hypothetical protein
MDRDYIVTKHSVEWREMKVFLVLEKILEHIFVSLKLDDSKNIFG